VVIFVGGCRDRDRYIGEVIKSVNSGHEKEIEEIKRIFETFVYMSEETLGDVTSQMTSQMSAQNVNMVYLAKSLEEAKIGYSSKGYIVAGEKCRDPKIY
jgi:hypothetical protein